MREVLRYRRSYEVFFFQAEDGIRDYDVTGVQTCALPISMGLTCSRHKATMDLDNEKLSAFSQEEMYVAIKSEC